jgi:hypothetical protein
MASMYYLVQLNEDNVDYHEGPVNWFLVYSLAYCALLQVAICIKQLNLLDKVGIEVKRSFIKGMKAAPFDDMISLKVI